MSTPGIYIIIFLSCFYITLCRADSTETVDNLIVKFEVTFDKPQDFLSADYRGEWNIENNALTVDAKGGAYITVGPKRNDPVICIEYDCWATAQNVSDLSVQIIGAQGTAFFGFGSEENTACKIATPDHKSIQSTLPTIKPGKRHHVAAQMDGNIYTLHVDGQLVLRTVSSKQIGPRHIRLYCWSGKAHFDNVRILTGQTPSQPQQVRPYVIPDPQTAKRNAARPWRLSDLEITNRPPKVASRRVPIIIQSSPFKAESAPMTFGVPFPKDEIWTTTNMRVVDSAGKLIPSQITPTATWTRAGSLRWVLVDLQANVDQSIGKLFLEYGSEVAPPPQTTGIKLRDTGNALVVDAGRISLGVMHRGTSLVEWLKFDDQIVMRAGRERVAYFHDQNGNRHISSRTTDDCEVGVELQGPLRTTLKVTGWYQNDTGHRACRYVTRIHTYFNQPHIRIDHTWIVTEDTDALWFQDLGIDLPLHNAPSERNGGWISVLDDTVGVTLSVRDMAQQFPAAVTFEGDTLRFEAWSAHSGFELDFRHDNLLKLWGQDVWDHFQKHTLREGPLRKRRSNGLGFARTHYLTLAFHEPNKDASHRAGQLSAKEPLAAAAPEWICNAGVLDFPIAPKIEGVDANKEKQIQDRFVEHVQLCTNLKPYVGFWDYGRGVPHNIEPVTDDDGKQSWLYSGYRANYDVGYGNPVIPWLLYARSGERMYLQRARATLGQIMDARIIHWHAPHMGRELGQQYKEHGTWTFDGWDLGFNGAIWPSNLPLAFYLTGDMRAMDVFGQIAIGYTYSKRKNPYYKHVINLGTMANYYRATWDKDIRAAMNKIAPLYLKHQRPDGSWPEREFWYEFALLEMMKLPEPEPQWVEAAQRFARYHIGPFRSRAKWTQVAGMQAWDYYQTGNPLYLLNAKSVPINEIPPLTEFDGLAYLRHGLVWMRLKREPLDPNAAFPKSFIYPRSHDSTFVIEHTQGQPTKIDMLYPQGEIDFHFANDRPVPTQWLTHDPQTGLFTLDVPLDRANTLILAQTSLPIVVNRFSGMVGRARLLPWQVNTLPLTVMIHGNTRFVQMLKNGGLTPAGTTWFTVPKGTRSFGVRSTEIWTGHPYMTITLPGGKELELPGDAVRVEVPDGMDGKVWGVKPKHPFNEIKLLEATFRIEPQFIELEDIPPFVAPSPELCFLPNVSINQKQPSAATSKSDYMPSPFGKAIRLEPGKRHLALPTGRKTDDRSVRKFFNARRGTIEMFIRFPKRTLEAGYPANLIHIPHEGSRYPMMQMYAAQRWYGQITQRPPDHPEGQGGRVLLLGYHAMPQIEPGRWHHVAIQWDMNVDKHILRRVYLDGYPYPFGEPSGSHDRKQWWPRSFTPPAPGDVIEIGSGGKVRIENRDAFIDELRISDVLRYPFSGPGDEHGDIGGQRAFDPPSEPFEPDEHTLMLFHFDGDTNGTHRMNQWVKCVVNVR